MKENLKEINPDLSNTEDLLTILTAEYLYDNLLKLLINHIEIHTMDRDMKTIIKSEIFPQ